MNNQIIIITLMALLVGGVSGYFIAELNESSPVLQQKSLNQTSSGNHMMSDGTMMGGKDMSMGMGHMDMMVKSERDFLEGMIPHHQEAVDTAKEVVARGGSTAEIKTLAENIIVAQEKEIAQMMAWYKTWYGNPYEPTGNYKPMMRTLSGLSGAALDKRFLEDMVMHHMGAIMMAQSVQSHIQHQEMADLTKAIATSQSAEILQMKRILGGM